MVGILTFIHHLVCASHCHVFYLIQTCLCLAHNRLLNNYLLTKWMDHNLHFTGEEADVPNEECSKLQSEVGGAGDLRLLLFIYYTS